MIAIVVDKCPVVFHTSSGVQGPVDTLGQMSIFLFGIAVSASIALSNSQHHLYNLEVNKVQHDVRF